MNHLRRQLLTGVAIGVAGSRLAHARNPVWIGLDLEISDRTSTSDDAIIAGAAIAVEQINARGGVLGGRPLGLRVLDNRSLPSRGRDNAMELAAMPDLVAYLCGKFSAVPLAQLDIIHRDRLILLDPWAAADGIIDHPYHPSYTFRLSLRDSWALEAMVSEAVRSGALSIQMIAPRNAWGRSSAAAARAAIERHGHTMLLPSRWYEWGRKNDFSQEIFQLRSHRPNALLLIANESDGAQLLERLTSGVPGIPYPVICHWGVLGGPFIELLGPAAKRLDLRVVSTVDLAARRSGQAAEAIARAQLRFGIDSPVRIPSAPGFAHAHDLVAILASAIERAGTTDRSAVRDALERLGPVNGLVRNYAPPFTPTRHEALGPEDVRMFRFADDGVPTPIITPAGSHHERASA